MSTEPNDNGTSSPIQQLLIGASTLIVIVVTVIAAVFLALQETPTPTPTGTPTPIAVLPPATTAAPPVTQTATFTPTPPAAGDTATSPATEEAGPPPTATDTPTITPTPPPPPPPTFTATPVVIIVTATSPPAPDTPVRPAEGGVCQPPADWIAYVIQAGDTLNDLAERTGTTVFQIQQFNCLETFAIQPGDEIYLPFEPPPPTDRPTPTVTGTRLPTPTRTSTPVTPIIRDVLIRIDEAAGEIRLIVTGENFRSREQGFRVELVGPRTIPLQLGGVPTSTSFEATAPLEEETLTGEYDLTVINPDGRLAVRQRVFPPSNATATPTPQPPRIDNITPDEGRVTEDVRITIEGRNFGPFRSGFEVELIPRDGGDSRFYLPNEDVRPATSTRFDILIEAGDLIADMEYDVRIQNPDGQSDTELEGYEALP